jgi:cephalosporin-C deacetylase
MAFFDMPLEQMVSYKPDRSEPADFDAFWAETLHTQRKQPLNATFTRIDTGMKLIETYDVQFAGYGGQTIHGWYARPAGVTTPLPCMVEYHGYGGGRGYPHTVTFWANAGYAHLTIDTRGQGGNWRRGDTADIPDGANPFRNGFMTQGVLSPSTYYYRRVFVDVVRALDTVLTRADVDADRIGVCGASQGGGMSIAAAALAPDIVKICLPDVPFLCHFRRAVGLTDRHPYSEIVEYLRVQRENEERVFNTLDYFDGVNLAPRIKADCLFSVALMDVICPPSTVYAAYNHLPAGAHDIKIYRWNDHEGGQEAHDLHKLAFARQHFGD